MNAWASALGVVTGKWALPMPSSRTAFCRGPSLNASPWTEWPGAGTAGLASEGEAVGLAGSWAFEGPESTTGTNVANEIATNQRANGRIDRLPEQQRERLVQAK